MFGEAGGRTFLGTVMGMERGKVHVLLDEPPIDVKAYLRHMHGEPEITADHTTLRDAKGVRYRVGDAVRVGVLDRERGSKRWRLVVQREG